MQDVGDDNLFFLYRLEKTAQLAIAWTRKLPNLLTYTCECDLSESEKKIRMQQK